MLYVYDCARVSEREREFYFFTTVDWETNTGSFGNFNVREKAGTLKLNKFSAWFRQKMNSMAYSIIFQNFLVKKNFKKKNEFEDLKGMSWEIMFIAKFNY